MIFHSALLQLSLSYLAIASARPSPTQNRALLSKKSDCIKWGTCSPDLVALAGNVTIYCANFTVPLDYTDHNSSATIDLELLKVPAPKGPSQGSILFNFGGPGDGGRSSMVSVLDTWLPYEIRYSFAFGIISNILRFL